MTIQCICKSFFDRHIYTLVPNCRHMKFMIDRQAVIEDKANRVLNKDKVSESKITYDIRNVTFSLPMGLE